MPSFLQPGSPLELSGILLIVVWAIVVLFVLVLASSFFLLVHHYVTERQLVAERNRVRKAAELLAPAIVAGNGMRAAMDDAKRRWGRRAVATVLRRARLAIRGDAAERISEQLEQIGEVDRGLRQAKSRSFLKRAAAMRRLGQCGGDRALEALEAGTEDKEVEVRRAAREGLLNQYKEEAFEAAIRSYLAETPFRLAWRKTFFARLAAVASPRLIELVRSGELSDSDEKLALEALAEERDPAALPLAIERLDSSEPEYRAAAAHLIGKLRYEQGADHLVGQLGDREWFVRASAARALAQVPCGPEGCLALGSMLEDPDWWVRSNAAYALAHHGDEGTRRLCEALEGSDRFAQHAALSALAAADLSTTQQERLSEILSRHPIAATDDMAVQLLKSNPALRVHR